MTATYLVNNPTTLNLSWQVTCALDAMRLYEGAERIQQGAQAEGKDAPPLPALGTEPERNCVVLATWLREHVGPFDTRLEVQRFFRGVFGSQVQRRWFNK